MKKNDESYLDSLLENVSANSDNLYQDMVNNDADSFQIDENDLEDFDLSNILDDLSFDTNEDLDFDELGSMDGLEELDDFGDLEEAIRQMDQEWEPVPTSPVTKESKYEPVEEAPSEIEIGQLLTEEAEDTFPSAESFDPMPSSEDDSLFEDNLMESLLAEEAPESEMAASVPEEPLMEEDPLAAFNLDGLQEEPSGDFGIDALQDTPLGDFGIDALQDMPSADFDIGALEDIPSDDSDDDAIADLDDLIGLLSEEEQNPETLDNLPMFNEEEEDVFSIHSLDDEENEEEESASTDLLNEDSFLNESMQELLEPKAEEMQREKKDSLFKKMFGNVHDEKALKQQKKLEEAEAAANSKTKEEKKAEKAEKKRLKDEAKKEKAALEAQKKSEKASVKKAKTSEKKAKKVQKLKVVAEEDEGRINRLGATFVFLFFGIVATGIILGTDSFSYTQSITKATEYFGTQKYNNAYDEVRGIKVKEKDEEIYDKIITVMYVNKQLNSYNNYYNMQKYPEALDSLLKGLERYDEYISIAKELGIKSDLDYVRKQILGELNSIFGLSETDSYRIIDSDSQETYSKRVIKAASVE